MSVHPVLIGGGWRSSAGGRSFTALDPTTGEALPDSYPVSPWAEVERAVAAADEAATALRGAPAERFADFLGRYAAGIEGRADALVAAAHAETGYPVSPRLKDGELPRTTDQLRQAAAAARDGAWALPTIDAKANIRSMLAPVGPVVVIGPNNFPFAFNSVSGGDFAAAVAAGCPVIAKGHPSHPTTTRLLAEAAFEAVQAAGLPPAFVQLIYDMDRADGLKLVADPRVGATAFTGSKGAGLKLKEAADRAGRLFYGEMSSINPVVVLPGALAERAETIADEFTASCLMGSGQFCTNPGLVVLPAGDAGRAFVTAVKERFEKAPNGPLLAAGGREGFLAGVETLKNAGATVETGAAAADGPGFRVRNTLLTVDGTTFLSDPHAFQTEAFGNGSLFVLADGPERMREIVESLEGNLTGCVYSDTAGGDDAAYDRLAPALAARVGRLLNDKMPTGVAVSPAMNHGGPYPATGHPGFTAVGIPASLRRFGRLVCYDNVRPDRLPPALRG